MAVAARLDSFQRRHPKAGFPLAVLYKYIDDQGGYLAALITYYGFVSLFPLLLLLSTILGFVLSGDPHAQQTVLHSAISQFPVIGDQLKRPQGVGGGTAGLVIGILGALYGGLGVAQAVQNAMNAAWTVPRNRRPNPLKARGRSLLLLLVVGVGLLATTALSAIGLGAGSHGAALRLTFYVASFALNSALFVTVFRLATARSLTVRQIAPGAGIAAVAWQLLQSFGGAYAQHTVRHASSVNAVFAVVLGLLAFLYLASVILMFCVEVNVVRVDRLYPRSLLTPFTNHVELTSGDRRAYTNLAKAQQAKGFQKVDVTYRQPPVG